MSTSKKYQVVDANTDKILAGEPSEALIEASYSSNEGFVDACCDNGRWVLAGGGCAADNVEVYVDETKTSWFTPPRSREE